MNQKQREYLIDKIKKQQEAKIKALEKQVPAEPDLEVFVTRTILNGHVTIKPSDSIRNWLMNKVTNQTQKSKDLIHSGGWKDEKRPHFQLPVEEIIDLPKDYIAKVNEYKVKKAAAEKEIREIRESMETLITRIHLASNKVLDALVAEIDDMGNLSLIDSSLKQIIAPAAETPKKIGDGDNT